MAYVIHIHAGSHGPARTETFARSPVRVGRNPLNDLVVEDPMVSQLHGVFSFERGKVSYVDVGSTNGSLVDGALVARNQAIPLADPVNARIQIGSMVLSATEVNVPDSALQPTSGAIFQEERKPTIFYSRPGELVGALGRGEMTHPAKPAQAEVQRIEYVLSWLAPALEAHHAASAELARKLESALASLPEQDQRSVLEALLQRVPHLGCEPELEPLFERVGADGPGLTPRAAQRFLHRVVEGMAGRAEPVHSVGARSALERVGAILETHGAAFVELRHGYHRFAEELGLLMGSQGELTAADRAALHRHLFDWTVDGAVRVDELKRAYAEIAIHQVALLQGIVAGIRSLLAELSPEALAGEGSSLAIRSGEGAAPGFFARIFPFARVRLFRRYEARHRALVEEDRFTRTVFGASFARAYFAVTGQSARADLHEGAHEGP